MCRRICIVIACSIALAILGCDTSDNIHTEVVRFQGQAFGTTYSIVIAPLHTDTALGWRTKLAESIDEQLHLIDSTMSNWSEESEISQLNNAPLHEWQNVSPELMYVLAQAKRIFRISRQTFDPSVGPLITLWGFQGNTRDTPPSQSEIAKARNSMGFDSLELHAITNQARRTSDIDINLSAIAKGYAVDRIAQLLHQNNHNHYLIEIGGEVRTAGTKFGKAWVLGIEKPDTNKRLIQQRIALGDAAIATSGSYRNYFESDGKMYQHIIDPRSGYPVDNGVVSVSVIADNATSADAFATAFMVLGKDSLSIAAEEKIDLMLIIASDTEQKTIMTPGFASKLLE